MLKIAWTEAYCHPLPEGHRFPMEKYNLIPEQLLYEGTIEESNLYAPDKANEQVVLETHDTNYFYRLKNLELTRKEIRRTGFPLSQQLVERELIITQGTIEGAQFAKKYGVAMNIAGGTHHAYADRGEGFCLLNDQAVAANYLINHQDYQRILIIDLDVHQGNGTAKLFQHNKKVFTFSMHGEKNYPMHKESSDLDIGLPDGTGDANYLDALQDNLYSVLEDFDPEFIFFQSGVDVLEDDKLGRLGLSLHGCKERDRMVLSAAKEGEVPIMISMGGGYSRKLSQIIEAHANTYRLAQSIFF